jgi:hypothetical protein
MNDMLEPFFLITVFLFGCLIGWVGAHGTVATECERLGSFYVGDTTYTCKVKE